jgi:adenylate cyclase
MGLDEVGTLRAVKALRKDLVDPAVAEHHGRVVKLTGDGILIEFGSAVDALSCAVAVQRSMAVRNADIPEDRRIQYRVGINVGDIIVDGDDIYGDGVNIAARLEGIADAGGICISQEVWKQVKGKVDITVRDMGEQRLKNIAEPVQVFSVSVNGSASFGDGALRRIPSESNGDASRTYRRGAGIVGAVAVLVAIVGGAVWFATRSGGPPQPFATAPNLSIVVLPFTNLSGDPAQDYLADVLTEELTTYLSRIPGTFVIARSTAFAYKGKPLDVKQIGKELGVRYVLEGSTQPTGNRLRVNTQLIDADHGAHLWADGFDADRTELSEMEEEIVTRLARQLAIQLTSAEAARIHRAHPANPDAEDLAMRCEAGLVRYDSNSKEAEAAFALCEQALQRDDHNVRALPYAALKYSLRVLNGRTTDRDADMRHAEELLSRLLAAEPDHPGAYALKGELFMVQARLEEAIVQLERSIALNPSYIGTYVDLCASNLWLGRPNKSIAIADKATRLSPRDPYCRTFIGSKV